MRLVSFSLFLLFGCAPALAQLRAPIRGDHYEIHSEGEPAEAQEWLRVLEAAWPQFVAYFGAEPRLKPEERMQVLLYNTQAAYKAGCESDGVGDPGGGGGLYAFKTSKAYFFRQPSAYYTRALMIHECAHQFHHRIHGNREMAGWYVEGVAEDLAQHTWDGERLQTAIVAPISLENYPAQALELVSKPEFDLNKWKDDGGGIERPVGMHMVRLLRTHKSYAKRFANARKRLDDGQRIQKAEWVASFGAADKLASELRRLIADNQQPFLVSFVDWDSRRVDRVENRPVFELRGTAPTVVSAARTRMQAQWLEFEVSFPAQGGRVGAQLDWLATNDHTVLLINGAGTGFVQRMTPDKGWVNLMNVFTIPAKDGQQGFGTRTVRLERAVAEEGSLVAVILLDGAELRRVQVRNTHFGPAFDSGVFDFRKLSFEASGI